MQITLGPQYNVGEKPTVILYIYINRHVGTQEKHYLIVANQRQCSTPSHMVVLNNNILVHYKSCKYKATTWYLTGFPTGSNLGSTV